MLTLIPLAAFLLTLITLIKRKPDLGWRRAFLRAAILWGVYTVLLTEVLSLIKLLDRTGLALGWGIPTIGLSVWLVSQRRVPLQLPNLKLQSLRLFPDKIFLGIIVLIVLITGFVAWRTPPQTWDSLIYHMTRVAHWTQEKAVTPFATGIEVQNSRPPWAEFAILQFYVLSGGDRMANLVEWFAMVGSLIGVSLLAKELRTGGLGEIMAVLFAATLPMGLVQASSTMNDYIVAFWVLCAAVEAMHSLRGVEDAVVHDGVENTSSWLFAAAASGLALATKPTAVAYLGPLAVLIAIKLFRDAGWRRTLVLGSMGVIVVAVLNVGYLARNLSIYGSPLNPNEVSLHGGQPINGKTLVSNFFRNASLHAGTPSPYINKGVSLAVLAIHNVIGADPNDPATTSAGTFRVFKPSTNENLAGNPLHALMILVIFGYILVRQKKLGNSLVSFTLTVGASFFLISLIFKWQVFGSRYHLPFFILSASIVGVILEMIRSMQVISLVGLVIVILSWPWLLSINSRPVLPREDVSYVGSIMTESRDRLYLANGAYLQDTYQDLTAEIKESGCSRVGVMISGNTPEYPIWVMLGAPREDLEIEWIVAGTPSERFEDPGFIPCAVICEDCPDDWETIRGIPLNIDRSGFQLYLGAEQK